MITFKQFYNEQNVAGGPGSAFGPGTAGSIGSFAGAFPASGDSAYAPGDYRIPRILGAKKLKKKGKRKMPIQRRPFIGM